MITCQTNLLRVRGAGDGILSYFLRNTLNLDHSPLRIEITWNRDISKISADRNWVKATIGGPVRCFDKVLSDFRIYSCCDFVKTSDPMVALRGCVSLSFQMNYFVITNKLCGFVKTHCFIFFLRGCVLVLKLRMSSWCCTWIKQFKRIWDMFYHKVPINWVNPNWFRNQPTFSLFVNMAV